MSTRLTNTDWWLCTVGTLTCTRAKEIEGIRSVVHASASKYYQKQKTFQRTKESSSKYVKYKFFKKLFALNKKSWKYPETTQFCQKLSIQEPYVAENNYLQVCKQYIADKEKRAAWERHFLS